MRHVIYRNHYYFPLKNALLNLKYKGRYKRIGLCKKFYLPNMKKDSFVSALLNSSEIFFTIKPWQDFAKIKELLSNTCQDLTRIKLKLELNSKSSWLFDGYISFISVKIYKTTTSDITFGVKIVGKIIEKRY